MRLEQFNSLPREEAAEALLPCLDIPRWCDAILDARPFSSCEELVDFAASAGLPSTDDELDRAMSHHARIGERPEGDDDDSEMSRREQSGVSTERDVQQALESGNRDYEKKFDQVFLIRAAGRSAEEILANLRARLDNTPEQERTIADQQLHEIAALRLEGVVSA